MVRLYRTFSNLIFTVVTRCVGYLYTVSVWFNPLEPPRTFSNHFSAEKARCVEVFDVSSEWFDNTEPSRHSGNKLCRVPVHYYRVVQPLEPPRTFSNHFSAEKERCVEVFDVSSEWFDVSSEWFDCTEPSRTSSTQW